MMKSNILDGKSILAVDDESDVLSVLEEEIMDACPNCTFVKATSYEQADKMLNSGSYDVVILDIMGVRGFELLETAVKKKLRPRKRRPPHSLKPSRRIPAAIPQRLIGGLSSQGSSCSLGISQSPVVTISWAIVK